MSSRAIVLGLSALALLSTWFFVGVLANDGDEDPSAGGSRFADSELRLAADDDAADSKTALREPGRRTAQSDASTIRAVEHADNVAVLVRDALDGRPIASARVRVEDPRSGLSPRSLHTEAKTDADGRTHVGGLLDDKFYHFVAVAPGYAAAKHSRRFDKKNPKRGAVVELDLVPESRLRLKLLREDGLPLAGATVRLGLGYLAEDHLERVSDARGHVAIDGLPAGTFGLAVHRAVAGGTSAPFSSRTPILAARLSFAVGSTTRQTLQVSGQVGRSRLHLRVSIGGDAADAARVVLRPLSSLNRKGSKIRLPELRLTTRVVDAVLNAQGCATLEGLSPGEYRMDCVSAPHGLPHVGHVTMGKAQANVLAHIEFPVARAEFTVKAPESILKRARLLLKHMKESVSAEIPLGGRERLVLDALAPGDYQLDLLPPMAGFEAIRVRLEEGTSAAHELRVRQPVPVSVRLRRRGASVRFGVVEIEACAPPGEQASPKKAGKSASKARQVYVRAGGSTVELHPGRWALRGRAIPGAGFGPAIHVRVDRSGEREFWIDVP